MRHARPLITGLVGVLIAAHASGAAAQSAPTAPLPLTGRADASVFSIAERMLYDPAAERAWVNASIVPATYEGILQGARGTLLTRSGNSMDAALLLGALLDASLARHRYAACPASALPVATPAPLADDVTSTIDTLLAHADEIASRITDPELADAIRAVPALRDAARADAAATASDLGAALGTGPLARTDTTAAPAASPAPPTSPVPASATPPAPSATPPAPSASPAPAGSTPAVVTPAPSATPAAPASAPATPAAPPADAHAWVQLAVGPGWTDLDPTTPDGTPPCAATWTGTVPPDAWHHTLRIALTVEQRSYDTLATSTALAVERPTADLATARITFGFGEAGGLLAPLSVAMGAPARYTPVLEIDDAVTRGTGLTLLAPGGENGPGGLANALDDAFGGPGASADPEPFPITAAWLDLTLTAPDGTATTMRSEVFDRIGVAARARGEGGTAPVQPLLAVLGDYAPIGAIWQLALLTGRPAAPELVSDGAVDPATGDGVAAQLDALLRVFPAAAADLGAHPVYPMLLLAGATTVVLPGGAPAQRLILDALHAPSVTPADAAAAATDASATLGAEQLLLRLVALRADTDTLSDTPGVLAAAHADGIPLVRLDPGSTVAIPGASADALARIDAHLAAGRSVVVPARAPVRGDIAALAWWVIDPTTGLIRDEHESGRHAAAVEYGNDTKRSVSWGERFRRLACRLAGPAVLAGGLLIGGGNLEAGADMIEQVAEAGKAAEENRRKGEEARKIACAE